MAKIVVKCNNPYCEPFYLEQVDKKKKEFRSKNDAIDHLKNKGIPDKIIYSERIEFIDLGKTGE